LEIIKQWNEYEDFIYGDGFKNLQKKLMLEQEAELKAAGLNHIDDETFPTAMKLMRNESRHNMAFKQFNLMFDVLDSLKEFIDKTDNVLGEQKGRELLPKILPILEIRNNEAPPLDNAKVVEDHVNYLMPLLAHIEEAESLLQQDLKV